MYLFGEETNRIVAFDPENRTLKAVDVKGQKVSEIKNYSGIIQKNEYTIFICGGINQGLDKINDNFFIFNPVAGTLRQMPNMKKFRYTFPLIYHEEKLFALGGRIYGSDDCSLLKNCESFDFKLNRWDEIASMNEKRCTSLSFVYNNNIWVFGGYTDHLKRSSLIEKYNQIENKWEIVPFKLYQGLEAGHVYPIGNNKIVLIGGKIYGGECNYVHEIDLQKYTILNKMPLTSARVLSKA